MKQNATGNRRQDGWNVVTAAICGCLLFGCLSFLYTVLAETYLKHNDGLPLKPYGSIAIFSILNCAFLGACAGTLAETLISGRRTLTIVFCAVANTLVALWYGVGWQQWNNPQWDSSSYIVFPFVFLAIGANVALLAVYLPQILAGRVKHGDR